MAKINLDKAQNVNINAKRGDDFNLALEILNEDGSSVQFKNAFFHQQDGLEGFLEGTILDSEGNIAFPEFYFDRMPGKHILVFTITDINYHPVLIASSERLDTNQSSTAAAGTIPSTAPSRAYARGVAKHLARYANGSTASARTNYGTELSGTAINMAGQSVIYATEEDRLTSIFNSSFEGYIAKGTITNANPSSDVNSNKVLVNFKNNDFLLQPGSYKYTFRTYYNLRDSATYSQQAYTQVFRRTETYLSGKLKVTE
jgi:hypothetical protein